MTLEHVSTCACSTIDIDLEIEIKVAPHDSTRITRQFSELCSTAASDWICKNC